ncbi:hypothetical protein P5G65_26195 [Paenibacillus chondroitinus]|uniref:Uncharacterized protein n=1 Tax=Paenibacillus chondroitinus TaxID=59842 RepID=A0ABU6DKR3_9BACL|nr:MULTISPECIES: hypothetical protein [Paenibacillus]MCY9657615.1 hypothetical protein [Paenibacillus anseongense]MEB4797402.1 hypothetical protein [Paenibacillus chondroitinus]
MERRVKELEELVIKQNGQLREIQSKLELLTDRVLRLSVCKASNGDFPFYDLILSYGITPDQQAQITRLFMALSEKLACNALPTRLKETESYSTDYLFSDQPIQYDDVINSIIKIWPTTDDSLPLSLIKAMKDQGMQVHVCDYLLSKVTT